MSVFTFWPPPPSKYSLHHEFNAPLALYFDSPPRSWHRCPPKNKIVSAVLKSVWSRTRFFLRRWFYSTPRHAYWMVHFSGVVFCLFRLPARALHRQRVAEIFLDIITSRLHLVRDLILSLNTPVDLSSWPCEVVKLSNFMSQPFIRHMGEISKWSYDTERLHRDPDSDALMWKFGRICFA